MISLCCGTISLPHIQKHDSRPAIRQKYLSHQIVISLFIEKRILIVHRKFDQHQIRLILKNILIYSVHSKI